MLGPDDFWYWARKFVVPRLRAQNLYNGNPPYGLRGYMNDGCNRVIGYAIFRQVRIGRFSCEVTSPMNSGIKGCTGTRGISTEDDRNYCSKWMDYETRPGSCQEEEFIYRNSSQLQTFTQMLQRASYTGGGYVFRLKGLQSEILDRIQHLQENQWIDKGTRLISLEFSVYNPNVNLFTSCVIYYELFEGGGQTITWKFQPAKLLSISSNFGDQIVVLCEIIFIGATVFFTLRELWEIKQRKCSYFSSQWSLIELILIIMSYLAVGLNLYTSYLTNQSIQIFNSTYGNAYVRMDSAMLVDQYYVLVLALIAFGATLKLIKLLQFNKRMDMLALTIERCWEDLYYFFIAFFVVFFAFACLFYFMFSCYLEEFARFFKAVQQCVAMMLGKFEFDRMKQANPMSPILFFVFSVLNSMILINIMLTIILQAFTEIKLELSKKGNKYDVLEYMWKSFKKFLVQQPNEINQVLPKPGPAEKKSFAGAVGPELDTEELPDKVCDNFGMSVSYSVVLCVVLCCTLCRTLL